MDNRYNITQDIRPQIKFLDEVDKLEKKRHLEQEREMLMKAAKVIVCFDFFSRLHFN